MGDYSSYILELVLIFGAFLLAIIAQSAVSNTYRKYSQIPSSQPLTGREVANQILANNNIHDVEVVMSRGGVLSDHYDPRKKIVALSQNIYNDNSIASVAVAAHEVGHAIQHHTTYAGIKFRDALLPVASISSQLAWGVIILSLFMGYMNLFYIGIAMIGAVALFQLVTLPVEFNASSRALKILQANYLDEADLDGAKAMLRAAAFTYVAAFLGTIANIVRLLLMSNRSRRD